MSDYVSPCLVRVSEGVYRCANNGLTIRTHAGRVICQCDGGTTLVVHHDPPCPLAPILHAAPPTADPTAYVARLHRCLAAGCKLIHRVDGRIVCVGRGRRCQWLGEWARFLAGDEDCPHWSAVVPPGGEIADIVDDDAGDEGSEATQDQRLAL